MLAKDLIEELVSDREIQKLANVLARWYSPPADYSGPSRSTIRELASMESVLLKLLPTASRKSSVPLYRGFCVPRTSNVLDGRVFNFKPRFELSSWSADPNEAGMFADQCYSKKGVVGIVVRTVKSPEILVPPADSPHAAKLKRAIAPYTNRYEKVSIQEQEYVVKGTIKAKRAREFES